MLAKLYLNNTRLTTDLGMILFSLIGCYLASMYGAGSFNESISIGLGYVSLILLAVTLLIGPINLLRKRKNPVNINFRRDIGIWCGITALIHVVFSLLLTPGKSIIANFTGDSVSGFGLFELGNDVGLVATIIMVALLITSNQISLKLLKGKRWKLIQRFNYPLILLVVLHTVALQVANLREGFFFWGTMVVSLAVVVGQAFGIATTIRRSNERKNLHSQPIAPKGVTASVAANAAVVTSSGQITMARRRFLTVTGATLLGGVVVSGAAGYLLGRSQGGTATQTQAQVLPNTATPAQNQNPAQNQTGGFQGNQGANGFNGNGGRRGGGFGQGNNTGTTNGNGTGVSNNPAQPATPAAGTSQGSTSQQSGTNAQAGSATTPASGTSSSGRTLVLANLSSLAVGAALEFTTPDTNETAFLIHEEDGSVKALSGICTHRPYKLVYNEGSHALVCNLHSVPFNIVTGAPTRSPARAALTSYKVHVDGQNNIVYDIS